MGRWGETWCRVLADEPDATVTVVAGRRAAARDDLGDVRGVADFREALASDDIDAVIVALPIELHLPAVRAAVERGLPTLCEKPLAGSRDEIAASAGIAVRVNQNYRLREWVHPVRELLPSLGRIERVEMRFAQPEFPGGGRDRLAHPLLADMAVHHLDLLRFLTGQEVVVRSAVADRPADCALAGLASVMAALELDDGTEVSYDATWASRSGETPWDGDWLFHGENGQLRVHDLAVDADFGQGPTRIATTRPPIADSDLALAWREFTAAVEGDEEAGVGVGDSARSMSLVLDISEAAGVPNPSATVGNVV
jgi:predicted dehydrogenase